MNRDKGKIMNSVQTIELNGRVLSYHDIGEGEAILFGHSFLWDSHMWEPQIEELSQSYRCIVPDLWAHGKSAITEAPSLKQMSDDFFALMQSLNIGQFHLVGLSIGGMWGTQLVLDHPENILSLTVMDSSVDIEPAEKQAKFLGMLDMCKLEGRVPAPLIEAVKPFFFSDHTINNNQGVVEQGLALWQQYEGEQMEAIVGIGQQFLTRPSLMSRLHEIKLPCLFMVGEQDRSRPVYESEAMASKIAGAKLEVIANAGHISNLENPEQVNHLLKAFLDSHS